MAIISVEGVILGGEGFVKRQIDRARRTTRRPVKAVVLRVDSPGGTVTGSDYIYHHLRKLGEETGRSRSWSAWAGSRPAAATTSRWPWATRPTSIFAEPTTWTGSIGVIIPHYDLSELLNENWGMKEDSIASHPLKGMGSFAKPMTDEEREIFQALVDDGFTRFKDDHQATAGPSSRRTPRRSTSWPPARSTPPSRPWQNGLVDKIGFVEDAVGRAIELAGLDKDDVCVVRYKPEPTLVDILFGETARSRPAFDLAALLDADCAAGVLPLHLAAADQRAARSRSVGRRFKSSLCSRSAPRP